MKPSVAASMFGLLAWIGLTATGVEASALKRMSLEKLTATNSTIVVGEVVDAYSYWNDDGSFILTDVVIEKEAQLVGARSKESRLVVTLLGGEVDDLTAVVLSGAHMQVGRSYVVFASESDLPGAPQALTVPDHSQGVFEIQAAEDGTLRAYSQAENTHLMADEAGRRNTPGGAEGLQLDRMLSTIQSTLESRKEQR